MQNKTNRIWNRILAELCVLDWVAWGCSTGWRKCRAADRNTKFRFCGRCIGRSLRWYSTALRWRAQWLDMQYRAARHAEQRDRKVFDVWNRGFWYSWRESKRYSTHKSTNSRSFRSVVFCKISLLFHRAFGAEMLHYCSSRKGLIRFSRPRNAVPGITLYDHFCS